MVRRLAGPLLGLSALAVTAACGADAPGAGGVDVREAPPWADVVRAPAFDVDAADKLAPGALLVRLSLDLRGVRPTEAEAARVAADPAALEGLIDDNPLNGGDGGVYTDYAADMTFDYHTGGTAAASFAP